MITSEKLLKVIEKFESLLPLYGEIVPLDMASPSVPEKINLCSTPCCHAGWYLVARFPSRPLDLAWTYGASFLSKDLGFEYLNELQDWAKDNPELWGNEDGRYMFKLSKAFTPGDKKEAETLNDIIDHWKEVYKRLKANETI